MLLYAAFALQTVSLFVREILWLRVLSAFGTLVAIVVLALISAEPQLETIPFAESVFSVRSALLWLVIMFVSNFVQIVRIIRTRQSLRWTEEELDVRRTIFHHCSPSQFRTLMNLAQWRTLNAGEILALEGRHITTLTLIYDGLALVQAEQAALATLGRGSFIGEMSFLTGNPASATVRTIQPTRCLSWRVEELRKAMQNDEGLKAAMQAVFSKDLLEKLAQQQAEERSTKPSTTVA